jgi:lipoate-protein ligase A
MHGIIAAALNRLGIACGLAKEEQRRLDTVLCFQQYTRGDVLASGSKIVGSAQRKQRQCLLQHGAILLATSPYTPQLPGIAEVAGHYLAPEQVQEAVCREFGRQTAWEIVAADWTDNERRELSHLEASKYASAAWNERR